jgi:hypothetical protein
MKSPRNDSRESPLPLRPWLAPYSAIDHTDGRIVRGDVTPGCGGGIETGV